MSKIKPANIHDKDYASIRTNNGQLNYDRDLRASQENSKETRKIYFDDNGNGGGDR